MEFIKECTGCHRSLASTAFRKQSGTKDGLQYICKTCASLKGAKRYEQKKPEIIQKVVAARADKREEYNAYQREYQRKLRDGEKAPQ